MPTPTQLDRTDRMADRIAHFDWAMTSLGPREAWPQALRTAVALMLALPQPAYIGWGPTLLSLYNDRYIPVLGTRHPDALGRPYDEVWQEIDAAHRAMLDATLAGHAQMFVDEPMALDARGGATGWFTFSWLPLRDDDGDVAGFLSVGQETTEKVLAAQALHENETRARLLVGALAQATWETDAEGAVTVDSPSWRAYTGQSLEESLGWGWLDAVHPEDRAHARHQWEQAVGARTPADTEFRVRGADGSWRWTHVRAVPLLDANGEVRKWLGMNVDIDARKRAQDAQRESEARLATLFEVLPVGVGVVAVDSSYVLLNPAMQRFLPSATLPSRDPDRQWRWRSWADNGTRLASTDFPVARALRGERIVPGQEMVYTDDSGHETWTRVSALPLQDADGAIVGAVNVVHDIDAIKRGTEAQRLNELRQKYLLRLADALGPLADPIAIRATATRVLGEQLGDVRVQYWEAEDDGEHVVTEGGYAQGLPGLSARVRIDDYGPHIRGVLVSGCTLVVPDVAADPHVDASALTAYDALQVRAQIAVPLVKGGRLVAVLAVHCAVAREWTREDVTVTEETAERTWSAVERARADERLRVSEYRLRMAVEASRIGTWTWDPRLDIGDCDERACELLGYPTSTPITLAQAFAERLHPDDAHWHVAALQAALVPGGWGHVHHDFRVVLPDGDIRWITIRARTVFDSESGDAERMFGTLEDATARKREEADLGFLAEFEHRLAAMNDATGTARMAAEAVATHFDATHCLLVDVDPDGQAAEVEWDSAPRDRKRHGTCRLREVHTPDELAALKEGRPVVIGDVQRECATSQRIELERLGVRALVSLPCVRDGRFVMALSVQLARAHDWRPSDVDLLRQLVDRLWLRLERVRADQARREQDAQQAFLLELTDALRPLDDPDEVATTACRLLVEALDASRAQYTVVVDDTPGAEIGEVRGEYIRSGTPMIRRHSLNEYGTQLVDLLRASHTLVLPDIEHDLRVGDEQRRAMRDAESPAAISVPRTRDGRLVATLTVHAREPRNWTPGQVARVEAVAERTWSAVERAHAEGARRASEQRLQTLMEGVPQLVWRAVGDGHWTWASPQWRAYTGQSEAESRGHGWLEPVHPDDRERVRACWNAAVDRNAFDVEYRILDVAEHRYRWFQTRAAPVRGHDGDVVEWLGTSTDVDELRSLQERQQVLVSELQHRTFNLMGVIRAMSDATFRSSTSLDEYHHVFDDRIAALGRVQRLLSRRGDDQRVTFDELIRGELDAVGALDRSDCVVLDGPPGVALRSGSVQTFAMALHELLTNAVKYGALKQPGARLVVRWHVEAGAGERPLLHVDWRETGVAMPAPSTAPQGTGQGRRLIEQALPYQLHARTSYALEHDGVHCTMVLPVSKRTPVEALRGSSCI